MPKKLIQEQRTVLVLPESEDPEKVRRVKFASRYMHSKRVYVDKIKVDETIRPIIVIKGKDPKCNEAGIKIKMIGGGALIVPHAMLDVELIMFGPHSVQRNLYRKK